MKSKAVFLDRDGVINEKRDDHVKNISESRKMTHFPENVEQLVN